MSFWNASQPADTDPAKQGASQLRSIKDYLNRTLSQIFSDTPTGLSGPFPFLPKWVTGDQILNSSTDDTQRAITGDHVKDATLSAAKLASHTFSADSAGRLPFADGVISSALLDPAIVLPTGSVNTAAIATGAVVGAAIASGAITVDKVGTGIVKAHIGSYAGSGTASTVVTGVGFAPTVLVLTSSAVHGIGIAYSFEASSGTSPLHASWTNVAPSSQYSHAITWGTDGFTVVPFGSMFQFNDASETTTYLALAF